MIGNGVANYEIRWIFDDFVVSGVDRMLNVDAVSIYQFVTMDLSGLSAVEFPGNSNLSCISDADDSGLHGAEKFDY